MKVAGKQLIQLIAEVLNCKLHTLSLQSGLGRHEKWDSLAHVTIMVAVEERHGVIIDETNIAILNTVEKLLTFINKEAT